MAAPIAIAKAAMRANFGLRANQKINTAAIPRNNPPQAPRKPTIARGAGKFMLLAIAGVPMAFAPPASRTAACLGNARGKRPSRKSSAPQAKQSQTPTGREPSFCPAQAVSGSGEHGDKPAPATAGPVRVSVPLCQRRRASRNRAAATTPPAFRCPPDALGPRGASPRPLCGAKLKPSKKKALLLARQPNPLLHLIEIFRQGSPSRGSQPVLGSRHAPLKKLYAGNVLRLLQLARVHAQVSVGCFQDAFQIVEAQRIVRRQRADDSQPDAFVNQPVQLGKLRGARGHGLAVF